MPNTKSAERRMRSSERKRLHNRSIVSRLRRLEKNCRTDITAAKKDNASKTLKDVLSALDKAVKAGAIPRGTANRRKSRLTLAYNRLS